MKVTAKRFLASLLVAVLALGTLAACGENEAVVTDGDKVKLVWWASNSLTNENIKSYDEVACFDVLEEVNNVDIEWVHPIAGQESEQFGVLISSGEYPDLISYANWNQYNGGTAAAIKEGVIIDLAPYMTKEYLPNYVELYEKDPERKKANTNEDGTIPLFASQKDDIAINAFIGPTIRKDWLDKLGLDVPETIDDWTNVLRAFKTQDPNGNGIADEIPFSAETGGPFHYFARAFGTSHVMMKTSDGKFIYGPTTPEFDEFIKTMNAWYEEGLLDKEYVANDRAILDKKIVDDIVGAYIGYTGSQMSAYLATRAGDGTDFDLVACPWPKRDENSPAYCAFDGMINVTSATNGTAVSTQNKYIDETMKIFNWLIKDGSIAFNYGIEGVTYNVVDGEYVFTDMIVNNPEGLDPNTALAPYAMPNYGIGGMMSMLDAYDKIPRSMKQTREAAHIWASGDMSMCIPAFTFSKEESDVIARVSTDVDIAMQEYLFGGISGINTQSFEDFVKNLETFGVHEMEAAYQSAYDRYMGK